MDMNIFQISHKYFNSTINFKQDKKIGRELFFIMYTANAYRQRTDKLMFKSVISTVR